MKRVPKIILNVLVWTGIAAYLIMSSHLGERKRSETKVSEIHIHIKDSTDISIIHAKDVEKWIEQAGLNPKGKFIDSINLSDINRAIAAHDFIREVNTSISLDGSVWIEIDQRKPVLRIITDSGYDIYYTEDQHIVPAGRHSPHYVPVVTGSLRLPFPADFSGHLPSPPENNGKKWSHEWVFLYKLINFVSYIENNDFWQSQIVQINVVPKPESGTEHLIELIPRVGDQVIMLGWLDNYESKLNKLMKFYRKVLPYEGWNTWSYIDLRYDGQVVCSRK